MTAIGEAKWRAAQAGAGELARLEHIRELLGTGGSKLLLFSRSGFIASLQEKARRRPDVELIDLERMYRGT